MPRMSAKVRAVTSRAFLGALIVLSVEVGIGVAIWSSAQWHAPVVVVATTTYLFAALLGILLAGERWPRLGDFIQSHSWLVFGCVMGSAAALLAYVVYPDPASLILGPFVLGFLILIGWGIQKAHLFGF